MADSLDSGDEQPGDPAPRCKASIDAHIAACERFQVLTSEYMQVRSAPAPASPPSAAAPSCCGAARTAGTPRPNAFVRRCSRFP